MDVVRILIDFDRNKSYNGAANQSATCHTVHTDAVVSFESVRALKLTLFESFRVLKS